MTEIHQYKNVTDNIINDMSEGEPYTSELSELITKYRYDKTGLLLEEIKPSKEIKVFSYDKNGNVLSMTDEEKNTTIYEYDAVNNLIKVNYGNNKGIQYTYNPIGQVVSMKDWNGITNYEVDALGRIQKVIDFQNRITEYNWNIFGKANSIKYPDGSLVNYSYDCVGNLIQVNDASNNVTTYSYDLAGNLLETNLPNGVKTVQAYDELQRLISLTDYSPSQEILDKYQYFYDNVGNKIKINRDKNLNDKEKLADDTNGESIYTYDSLNQLIKAEYSNGKVEKYFYDSLGNRIRKEISKSGLTDVVNYQYNDQSQLTQVEGDSEVIYGIGADTPIQMKYDARGNLIEILKNGEQLSTYKFDETNQMTEAINQYGMKSTYKYDGSGARIYMSIEVPNQSWEKNSEVNKGKSVDETYKKEYHYINDISTDNNRILMLYGSQNKTQRYTYGKGIIKSETVATEKRSWDDDIGQLFAQGDQVVSSYYLLDELGSSVKLVGDNAEVQAKYSYDDYGRPLVTTYTPQVAGLHNIYGYTGYQYDIGTGLYYAGARYYMPEVGRFVSEDLFKGHVLKPVTLNPYIYVWNNPLRYIDIDGESPTDILQGAVSALDNNLFGGFVKKIVEMAKKKSVNYVYDSEYDYYLGRVVGDVLSILIGSGEIVKGIFKIIGSFVSGGGITVLSGGMLAIGGITISVAGVAVGTIEVTYGGAVVSVAVCNMSDDFNRMQSAKDINGNLNKISQESLKKWNKGSFDSVEKSLEYHYKTHGKEVGASDIDQYVRKADGFRQNLSGATKSYPKEGTPGAIRYTKNGKYIIIAPDKTIISFGLAR